MIVNLALGKGFCLGVTELRLRLPFELRLGNLNRNNRGQTLTHVFTGEVIVFIPQQFIFASITIHQGSQRSTETFFVSAAFVSVDRIRIGVHRLFIRPGPLHSHLKRHMAHGVLSLKVDNIFVNNGF